MSPTDLVVVSNRGPVSFRRGDDGQLVAKRGAGGLVSCLGPAAAEAGALWIACAISDEDREAAAAGVREEEGFRHLDVVVDPDTYRRSYDQIANATLWFAFHRLYDLPRRPSHDRQWREAWECYRRVNETVASAVIDNAPQNATVLVHDYHLTLVGSLLAERRPDLLTAHFTHTPFADPDGVRTLPDFAAEEMLQGMAGFGACGFHSRRWAQSFEDSSRAILGSAPPTFVSPAATDPSDIQAVAGSEACHQEVQALDAAVGGRLVIGRVDRLELSKNIVRGFLAFDEMLSSHPDMQGRVCFAASVYPSREALAEYKEYAAETEALVTAINSRWGTEDWIPILWDADDFFPRSVAVLRRADVLLVNPIRDGLNLVAKEGALVNERNAVLVLSREAGVHDELGDHALSINPFDVSATAEAMYEGLTMETSRRRSLSTEAAAAAVRSTPAGWMADQVAAASRPRS